MSTMWAQRREELLSDCLVSPEVFTPLIDRLVEFVVPEAARSEMGVRLFNELQLLRDLNERHELGGCPRKPQLSSRSLPLVR